MRSMRPFLTATSLLQRRSRPAATTEQTRGRATTYQRIALLVDRKVGWDKLPVPLGLAVLAGVRDTLRRANLYDTRVAPTVGAPPVGPPSPRHATERTADGSYNSLSDPTMGMARTRFGRNVPLGETWPEPEPAILEPSPRLVSRELLTRDTFVPATSVNSLAAAWLQFMVRDWFSHGKGDATRPWRVPVGEDDAWWQKPMEIPRTVPDPTRPPDSTGFPPTYLNTETPWWDGSQLYGVRSEQQSRVRSGVDGKLRIGADGLLPLSADPERDPIQEPGFWLGLYLLATLFTLEHNGICDRLKAEYPHWSDEELFQRARLINAALLAKIHTTEWTPAIISHPTLKVGMRANWFGLAEERIHKLLGRLSPSQEISGIPGSPTALYGVPYSLTEEFTAVYRMHPLIADEWSFRSAEDDRSLRAANFRELVGVKSVEIAEELGMPDLLYSFGTGYPGAIQLHNYPKFLQEFERPDGTLQDLAATDVMRIRELGVPRYCAFRRALHLKAPETFEELTDHAEWAEQLRRVYGDVERVDTMVGMFAERKPAGFAFSDTAFRVFLVMATRRLNGDRFFTEDYRPEVYTQAGMDWIDDNQMGDVLLRHFPQLRPFLRGLDNAFTPWTKAASVPA
jgi:Animal haem peroxidase